MLYLYLTNGKKWGTDFSTFETEEGQKEFEEWKTARAKRQLDKQLNNTNIAV